MEVLGNPALTSSNTTKEYIFPRFYKMIDTIKDRPKTYDSIRQRHGLNREQLKETFRHVCSLMQSKYMTLGELVTVVKAQFMKAGLRWGTDTEELLRTLLPGQHVTEGRFVEAFLGGSVEEPEEECLLHDLPPATLPVK